MVFGANFTLCKTHWVRRLSQNFLGVLFAGKNSFLLFQEGKGNWLLSYLILRAWDYTPFNFACLYVEQTGQKFFLMTFYWQWYHNSGASIEHSWYEKANRGTLLSRYRQDRSHSCNWIHPGKAPTRHRMRIHGSNSQGAPQSTTLYHTKWYGRLGGNIF